MKLAALKRRRYDILTGILLAMLMLRAYVPTGFMPAPGTPFLLELCPSAAPMPISLAVPAHLGHHHHAQTHGHFENCPFGSAPGAAPASQLIVFQPSGQVTSLEPVGFESESFHIGARVARAHQPRGPPALA